MNMNLRVSVTDVVNYALAEDGQRSFINLYEKIVEGKKPKRTAPFLWGRIEHETSANLWMQELSVVSSMYARNRWSHEEFVRRYKKHISHLIDGSASLPELNEARNQLGTLITDDRIAWHMETYARQFVELRFRNLKSMLRHRTLPHPIYPNKQVRSNCFGPLLVGLIDISEYEHGVSVNLRELKRVESGYSDYLQVSLYGIMESQIPLTRRQPTVKTFLDYVPYGPMGVEVDYEKAREEGQRLVNELVKMLEKPKDEVKKMDKKKKEARKTDVSEMEVRR